jgi:hypothetical protein
MRPRRNYGAERRSKAQARQAKQQGKRDRKADRLEAGERGPEMGDAQDAGTPSGMWEWFSPSRTRVVTTEAGTRPATDPPDDWVILTDPTPESEGGTTGNSSSPPAS